MTFIKNLFAKLMGDSGAELRARYIFTKEFFVALHSAEQVYANDPGRLPINKADYLALLNGFECLLSSVKEVPTAYDTDFRRNLPGGGIDGLAVVPDILGRIDQARRYLRDHEATAQAGEALLQNINACLNLVDARDFKVDATLDSIAEIIKRIASGVIRPAEIHSLKQAS